MRIGLVIYGGLDTLSGGYLYDRILVDYLKDRGDQVEIISLPENNYLGQLTDNLWVGMLADLEVDVLLQDELCHTSLLRANRLLQKKGTFPLVSIVHHLRSSETEHSPWLNKFYARIERVYLRGVDGFIYNSHTTRRVVEEIVGLGKPAVVAEPGADRLGPDISPAAIRAHAREPGPLRMLFLGNVIPRKGLEVLLQALRRLSDLEWQLTVVGSLEMHPDYAGRMVELAAEPGLAPRIQFRGALLDEQLADVMRRSQLMVLPSYYEGFGIAYLEAMGFGMPVVAAETGAAPEIIINGTNGYLVSSGDLVTLAETLRGLIRDRELLAEMGVAAQQRYQRGPRWTAMGRSIRVFLLDLLAGWPHDMI